MQNSVYIIPGRHVNIWEEIILSFCCTNLGGMNMETNYIPEFLALAECGSSYVAAEKLFTTQSTLLRHIQSIEDEFGMPLFDRTRKGFILNEAGKIFLPYARQIAGLKNNCYSILHHGEESDSVVHLFAEGKIIDLMIDFRKLYPDIRLIYTDPDNPEEALFNGELDVAFFTNLTPRMAENFQTIRFAGEEVLALLYEDHPLASKSGVTLEEMVQEDQIMLAHDVVTCDQLTRHINDGKGPRVVTSVPTGPDLIRMVREKLGVAVIHGQAGMIPPASGLKVLPLEPSIRYELNICFRKDTPLGKAAETFVNYAKRWSSLHQDVNRSLIE